jgi:hypothetical protein
MPRRHLYWIESETEFDAIRAVVGTDSNFAKNYAAWAFSATKKVADMESCGWRVEKVPVRAKDFIRYCDCRGVKRDLANLSAFAIAKAHGQDKASTTGFAG